MGKFKGIIVGVCEDYESGLSVYSISKSYGLPMCEVADILKKFGGYEVFPEPPSTISGDSVDFECPPKVSITAKFIDEFDTISKE
jgi:hypothetical protein